MIATEIPGRRGGGTQGTVHKRGASVASSDAEDLERGAIADGDPVRLRHRPVQLVDRARRRVGQDRVLDRARDRRDVPD